MKFYWNTAIPFIRVIDGCFGATKAGLSSRNSDLMAPNI